MISRETETAVVVVVGIALRVEVPSSKQCMANWLRMRLQMLDPDCLSLDPSSVADYLYLGEILKSSVFQFSCI